MITRLRTGTQQLIDFKLVRRFRRRELRTKFNLSIRGQTVRRPFDATGSAEVAALPLLVEFFGTAIFLHSLKNLIEKVDNDVEVQRGNFLELSSRRFNSCFSNSEQSMFLRSNNL
jgi:hypothetical protein